MGVPLSIPSGDSVNPGGSDESGATDQVPPGPNTVSVCEYATLVVAFCSPPDGVNITLGVTRSVNVLTPKFPASSSTCSVNVKTPDAGRLQEFYEHLLSASIDTAGADTNLFKATLDSIRMTQAEYDQMMKAAEENPDLWTAALDSLLKHLNARKEQNQPE